MNAMPPRTRAHLDITDFTCDPAAITRVLAIAPSSTWEAGAPRVPQGGPVHRTPGWRLNSLVGPGEPLTTHAMWLLGHLPSSLEALSSVTEHWSVLLSFAIDLDGEAPEMYFDASIIARLGSLNAAVDIDCYP